MTPATCIFHQAAEIGIKPMDFVDMIVQLGFDQHKKRDMNNQPYSSITVTDIMTNISRQLLEDR